MLDSRLNSVLEDLLEIGPEFRSVSDAFGHQVSHFVQQYEHERVFIDEWKMRRLGFVTQTHDNVFSLVLRLGGAIRSHIILRHVLRIETIDKAANGWIRHGSFFRLVVVSQLYEILA